MAYSRLHANYDSRGHSSAVSSVLFSTGSTSYLETKQGAYIYHGDAGSFHEWEFRTRLRMQGVKDDQYAEHMSKVVDGLRGDAFVIATQVGLEQLWKPPVVSADEDMSVPGGVDVLVQAMKSSVFPLTTHEAKELFRQYCKPNGSLARQAGESMHQFVSRRRRCWTLLKELDNEIELSEGHRADMLLDLAGLDKPERTMIQASIANARVFEKLQMP